jgi:ADP-heptose:LPS heptosyltransferase
VIVLGISLLRLGDLILQKPLIEGLKQKHPQSEIHLLINKQFSQVEFLFAGIVDRFIYFDRELLQKSCGEKEFSIFWGLQNLKNLVGELNQTNYDVVYNFTHNRLTAHIAGLVNTPSHQGIFSQQGQFLGLGNPWIQFFNSYFGRPEAAGFHYTELLAKALEIPLRPASTRSKKVSGKKQVLIQALTSDPKKNWHLDKFKMLADRIAQETSYEVLVLGAPFEKDVLAEVFPESQLRICDFKTADEFLSGAALLVTGDTSIKHLAALREVPIVELALGSSQPLQVGSYSHDSVVLQTRVNCGPCPHSQPCSQSTHVCGDRLSVQAVFESVEIALGLKPSGWELFAQRQVDLNIYRTEIRHGVGWIVQCLSLGQKNKFDEIIQRKMMIVEELDRRHLALTKGVLNEQRTRKLSDSGAEAS